MRPAIAGAILSRPTAERDVTVAERIPAIVRTEIRKRGAVWRVRVVHMNGNVVCHDLPPFIFLTSQSANRDNHAIISPGDFFGDFDFMFQLSHLPRAFFAISRPDALID